MLKPQSTGMNTRMEDVAVDVALTALRSICIASDPPFNPEALKEAFRDRWPTEGSHRPMNDAISAAAQPASSCSGQDYDSWHSAISKSWQPAVEEVIEQYFKAARHSFKESDHIQGAETLTDAVRATMGHIAATRDWPHHSHDTFSRVFRLLDPEAFRRWFLGFMSQSAQGCEGVLANDGKPVLSEDEGTLRRSYDRAGGQSPPHLVSA